MAKLTVVRAEPKITLELSEDEASQLMGILGDLGHRSGIDAIDGLYNQLKNANVPRRYHLNTFTQSLGAPFLVRV